MTEDEISFIGMLNAQFPDREFKQKDQRVLMDMFDKFFGGWTFDLFQSEKKQFSHYRSKNSIRFVILNWLREFQGYANIKGMTDEHASKLFFQSLTTRPANQALVANIFEYVE